VQADPLSVVNALRAKGCAKSPPSHARAPGQDLDRVASELARETTGSARDGETNSPPRPPVVSREGLARRPGGAEVLADRYCAAINAPGTSSSCLPEGRRDLDRARAAQPKAPVLDPAAAAHRVLALVNDARSVAASAAATTSLPPRR